jgi:uncharacterized Tic20 family protein
MTSLPPPPQGRPREPSGSDPSGWSNAPAPYRAPISSADERMWAMAAHLSSLVMLVGIPSLIGPLVVWLVKRDQSAFVDDHGKEALNFNISVLLYGIVGVILTVILAVVTLGIGLLVLVPLGLLLGLGWVVVTVIAAVKANNGEAYRYPLTIRFVR